MYFLMSNMISSLWPFKAGSACVHSEVIETEQLESEEER